MTSESDNPFSTEPSKQICPQCDAELQIRSGSTGPFLGCSAYPACDYTRPLSPSSEVQVLRILDDVCCPECEGDLGVKSGKFGMFIGCMNYPECDFTVKEDDDDDFEPVDCPKCDAGELHMRTNKKGQRFYACNQYPDCDYLVNQKPIAQACLKCEWPLVVENSDGELQCPFCRLYVD